MNVLNGIQSGVIAKKLLLCTCPSNNPTVKQRCNRVGHIVGMTLESNLGTLLFFGIVGATLSSDVAPLLVY